MSAKVTLRDSEVPYEDDDDFTFEASESGNALAVTRTPRDPADGDAKTVAMYTRAQYFGYKNY